MNEKNILLRDVDKATVTDSSSDSEIGKEEIKDNNVTVEIDYKQIEDCYYNALKRVEQEKADKEALRNMTKSEQIDVVDFATSTDAKLYTVTTAAAPVSSAQQSVAYLLDIRNILLIFLFAYFLINVYSKLKYTLSKYYSED